MQNSWRIDLSGNLLRCDIISSRRCSTSLGVAGVTRKTGSRQTPGLSTVTSTSISSEGGNPCSSQQMEQQDQEEELIECPTNNGRTSRDAEGRRGIC